MDLRRTAMISARLPKAAPLSAIQTTVQSAKVEQPALRSFSANIQAKAPASHIGRSALKNNAQTPVAVISDMDQTLIPAHDGDKIPDAFSGAVSLLSALDQRGGENQQNIFYVTARNAESARPLSQWLKRNGLPQEHVESGGGPDTNAATNGKLKDICAILEAHPDRRFVLLGDSSHVDSDVYREVAKRYPEQVEAVFIHKVEPIENSATHGQFVFENYGQVATVLRNRGLLGAKAWAQVVNEVTAGA